MYSKTVIQNETKATNGNALKRRIKRRQSEGYTNLNYNVDTHVTSICFTSVDSKKIFTYTNNT